ncbi:glutaminyl-peptide cyclotransferase [Solemya elarraichensis gill symbiont]|nr:glutaminyl-peptide cyclotransferase [Solemya elarraichensis gill symbiont]
MMGGDAWSVEQLGIEIVKQHPHPGRPFTQGFLFDKGLVESSGGYGKSYIQRYQPGAFAAKQRVAVNADYFAEGMAKHGASYYLLTWKSRVMLQLDPESMEETGRTLYSGEGWGLASDGRQLLMSNGSSRIRFFDPFGVVPERSINVSQDGKPVNRLNELEWIEDKIFANIWLTDRAVIIDPQSGEVTATIDLSLLRKDLHKPDKVDVINGFAWDAESKRLFVTGKNWPLVFEIRLTQSPD